MKAQLLRLDELQIDGFGHFHEFKIELGPGLNVLYGENEVGKSTLMAFVRSVLFGFARRNAPERYEPVGGKAFGGRLLLHTPHGELWVQRVAGKGALGDLTVKNGVMAPVPESKLREALASVDRGLFEQVFAFGLDELRSWSQMIEAGNVNEALAAASMQGAQGLPLALKKFEAEADQLWGERASKRELNLALAALASVRARRQVLGDRPGAYFSARAEHQRTLADEGAIESKLKAAQAEEFLLERLGAAAGHVDQAINAQAALEALPKIDAFPPDGAAQLQAALGAVETARASAARADGAVTAFERRLAALKSELAGRPPAPPVAAALEGWRAVAGLDAELPGRRADLEQRQARLGEAVGRLGLGGSFEGVEASSAARAKLTGIRTRLASLLDGQARAEEVSRGAAARAAAVERELAEREAELAALGPLAQLPSFDEALEAARALGNLEHQAQVIGAQVEDRQTALAAAEVPDEPAPAEQWPLVWVAPLGLGLLALAGMTGALAGFGPGALALLAAIALDGLLIALHRKGHGHWLSQTSAWQAVVRHRKTHRERLASELTQARSKLSALEQRLAETRAIAGVPAGAAPGPRLAELERIAGQAGRRTELMRDLALARARKGASAVERTAAAAQLAEAEAAVGAGRAELDAALRQLGLPTGLDASGALELLAEIALVQSTSRTLADLGAALGRDAARVQAGAEALGEAAARAGAAGKSHPEHVAALAAWLSATTRLEADAATTGSKLEDALAAREQCRADAAHAQTRVDALLKSAGAADVEAFRRAAAAFEARSQALAELRHATAGVEAACGRSVAEAHAQLLVPPGIAPRLQTAQKLRLELEQARRAVHERRGALAQQLSGWESDAELGRLLELEQALIAKAEQLARRAAVARLAQAVLRQAREKFEAEHQPQLILGAAETFKQLTDGRYPRLAHDAQSGALHVVDRFGKLFSPDQLSRGTREQLLISLRLAMIEQFGRERLALPVLVDDVLVNSDPRRAERMVAVLARLATRHQVIAFTCHPQFRELFKAHGAKAIEVSTRAQLALLPS